MIDVRVIGGGPAGGAAAIRLARSGRSVRLFEKSRFPRPKLCGGFLSFESFADLDDFHVLDALRRAESPVLRRTVIASRGGRVAESPLPAEALSVSRATLDQLLLEEARRCGVEVREGANGLVDAEPAAMTVMATGRSTAGVPLPSSTSYVGLQALFADMPGVTDQVELDAIASGYVGLARQREGVNLCAFTTPAVVRRWGPDMDRVLAQMATENPVLARHLRAARRVSAWLAVGPVRLGIRQLANGSTFYVGDAACVVDPFAGEGMSMALYSARLLTEALAQIERPAADAYRRLWTRAFLPSLRWNALIRTIYGIKALQEPSMRLLQWAPKAIHELTALTRYRRLELQ